MSNKNVFYLNAEYETLREWCLEIIRFLQTEFQEEGMFYFTNQITSLIENIDKKKSISKMRALYKEINILVGEEMLTSSQMDSLNNILTKKFNHSINDEFDKETKKIEVIINRGKIINNKEFELVKRREEQIYADESQIEYAETLRRLMADYE